MINLHDPPPRRWIESTLAQHCVVPQIVDELTDTELARRLVAVHPHFHYGTNASNRFAHGGWAYLTLGLDGDAWQLLAIIERTGPRLLKMKNFPVPTAAALIFIYAAMRLGKFDAARLGLQLARLHRLTHTERDDLDTLEACLQAVA